MTASRSRIQSLQSSKVQNCCQVSAEGWSGLFGCNELVSTYNYFQCSLGPWRTAGNSSRNEAEFTLILFACDLLGHAGCCSWDPHTTSWLRQARVLQCLLCINHEWIWYYSVFCWASIEKRWKNGFLFVAFLMPCVNAMGLSEVWLQRRAFFVDANCFAALSLQPLGVPKLKTQTAVARGFITKWMSKMWIWQGSDSGDKRILFHAHLLSLIRRLVFIAVGPSSLSWVYVSKISLSMELLLRVQRSCNWDLTMFGLNLRGLAFIPISGLNEILSACAEAVSPWFLLSDHPTSTMSWQL